jgi:hypothetical protein
MTARFSLIPRRVGADFMRLRAIAHARRVMRLRATALALRRAPLQFLTQTTTRLQERPDGRDANIERTSLTYVWIRRKETSSH